MGSRASFQWSKIYLLCLSDDLESTHVVSKLARHCCGVGLSIIGVSSNFVALKVHTLDFSVGVSSSTVAI